MNYWVEADVLFCNLSAQYRDYKNHNDLVSETPRFMIKCLDSLTYKGGTSMTCFGLRRMLAGFYRLFI